jgi:ATP-dependent DNA helicase RecG
MQHFVQGELDMLVSTTVIEVGVDVPNATVMMIEDAERFGLAQLHQLRGRVGRSGHQGYCYLLLADSKSPSRRLRALASSSDGFKLAELDLDIRGPGAIYGTLQHGQLDLRIAKLSDSKLIAAARNSAKAWLEQGDDLVKYKQLMTNVNRLRAVTNLN